MDWFNSIIFGFLSGITEFLPISTSAHQKLYLLFSGLEQAHPLQMFMIHIGCIAGFLTSARQCVDLLFKKAKRDGFARSGTTPDIYDLRLVRTSAVPLLIGLVIFYLFKPLSDSLLFLMLFLFINGVVLYIPERMLHGNKDARRMSVLDSYLIGVSGSLAFLPGISGVGTMFSSAIARGADKKHAFKWVAILVFYTLCALAIFDILSVFSYTGKPVNLISALCWLLSAVFAYLGSCLSIRLLRFLSLRNGISGFAYYSWGAAFMTFILYLTVV